MFQEDGTAKALRWGRIGGLEKGKRNGLRKERPTVQQVGHHRTSFYKALAFNMSKMGTTENGEALTIFEQRSDKKFPRGRLKKTYIKFFKCYKHIIMSLKGLSLLNRNPVSNRK